MNIRRRNRRGPIVSINAMSDIAFLLLIFIMLISLINYRQEIKIDYPEAEFQEVTQADKNLEIWINSAGGIFFNGKPVSLASLEGIIADAVTEDPSVRIHILADRNTPYKHVDKVIELMKLLQHRVVSLVVKDKAE